MNKILVSLLVILFVFGCERTLLESGDVGNQTCTAGPNVYASESQVHATWVTPDGDVSEVTIDYENQTDKYYGELTPIQVAEVAHWTRVAAQNFVLEKAGDSITEETEAVLRAIEDGLRHTHYIVAADDASFYWQFDFSAPWEETKEDHPRLAAFVRTHCYKLPDGATVSSIYKDINVFELYYITHELTHPIGVWVFGDGDGRRHENPDLWVGFGENSIQGRAMRLYMENNPEIYDEE